MTDRELDRIMGRILLDSLKKEAEEAEQDQAPPFVPTPGHQRQMRAMLADPLRWSHRQARPVWKRIAQRAAVILLACILAFGGVMALHPTARAAVIRWAVEWYEGTVNYLYSGKQNAEALPQYGIAELPDGYTETARDIAPGLVSVTYANQRGDVIYLDYVFMQQGSLSFFHVEDADVFDIQVNGMDGKFFQPRAQGDLCTVFWIDTEQNLQFSIDGCFARDALLHMADSISLCKTPN